MYLSQSLVGWGTELMAFASNLSMNRFAIKRLMRDPWLHHGPLQNTHYGKRCRYFKAELQQGDDFWIDREEWSGGIEGPVVVCF